MGHLLYLGVLAFCLLATAPLEVALRLRVYRRWRRLILALLPTLVVFGAWDMAAIYAEQWGFVQRWVTGVVVPGRLPLEELLFFLVIPVCAVLTLEAIRRTNPQWTIGDEPTTNPPPAGPAPGVVAPVATTSDRSAAAEPTADRS